MSPGRSAPVCLASFWILRALLVGRTLLLHPASCALAHRSGSSLQFPRDTGVSFLHILIDKVFIRYTGCKCSHTLPSLTHWSLISQGRWAQLGEEKIEAPEAGGLLEVTQLLRCRAGWVPRSAEVQGLRLLSCAWVVCSWVSWWWQKCLL